MAIDSKYGFQQGQGCFAMFPLRTTPSWTARWWAQAIAQTLNVLCPPIPHPTHLPYTCHQYAMTNIAITATALDMRPSMQ
eukprot:820927-Rhodomonas_salina.1